MTRTKPTALTPADIPALQEHLERTLGEVMQFKDMQLKARSHDTRQSLITRQRNAEAIVKKLRGDIADLRSQEDHRRRLAEKQAQAAVRMQLDHHIRIVARECLSARAFKKIAVEAQARHDGHPPKPASMLARFRLWASRKKPSTPAGATALTPPCSP